MAGRVTNRFKMKVIFDKDYEAKGIRAFMVMKELQAFVRYLSVTPDIVNSQNPNLEGGLEIDLLSQESPQVLHKLASSVLEVTNVQIFTETISRPVLIIDPPSSSDSVDEQVIWIIIK